jgi:hypothetical protein
VPSLLGRLERRQSVVVVYAEVLTLLIKAEVESGAIVLENLLAGRAGRIGLPHHPLVIADLSGMSAGSLKYRTGDEYAQSW